MEEQNKTNYYKLAFYIIIFLIGISLIVYSVNEQYIKEYNNGYNQGAIDGQIQLIKGIQSTGNIPYIYNDTIQTVSINKLCEESS
jgi:hypothetical protein